MASWWPPSGRLFLHLDRFEAQTCHVSYPVLFWNWNVLKNNLCYFWVVHFIAYFVLQLDRFEAQKCYVSSLDCFATNTFCTSTFCSAAVLKTSTLWNSHVMKQHVLQLKRCATSTLSSCIMRGNPRSALPIHKTKIFATAHWWTLRQ